jgi:hypothetical protein
MPNTRAARRAARANRARANLAADRATSLPEVWANVAKHLGFAGARWLMLVCRASNVGAKDFLRTLPSLFLCGWDIGAIDARMLSPGMLGAVHAVWRLDLATLQWEEAKPGLIGRRASHACCAVRGALVVLGG